MMKIFHLFGSLSLEALLSLNAILFFHNLIMIWTTFTFDDVLIGFFCNAWMHIFVQGLCSSQSHLLLTYREMNPALTNLIDSASSKGQHITNDVCRAHSTKTHSSLEHDQINLELIKTSIPLTHLNFNYFWHITNHVLT